MRIAFEGLPFSSLLELFLSEDATLKQNLLYAFPSQNNVPWNQLAFNWNGKCLDVEKTVSELMLQDQCRIRVFGKLCGGGGDGGSTGAESRDAYLKMYQLPKADKVDQKEENFAKWTRCQISGETLTPPCVCDELGTLFNKEAIIKALIDRTLPKSLSHITSLKHLISLQLTPKPPRNQSECVKNSKNYQTSRNAEVKFRCPITDLEMNGCYRFSVYKETGHVVSDKAIKEAPKAVSEILGAEFTSEDWLPLNGDPEVVQNLKDKMISKRKKVKSKKTKRSNAQTDSVPKKKLRATDYAPKDASMNIYASIFDTEERREKETFLCRSVAARGMNLT